MKTIHLAIILDRSGSMEACRDATISGFNEYITGIRESSERAELETRVTLVTFNHGMKTAYFDEPLARLKPISRETYVPEGNTAMLDAVCATLKRLEKLGAKRPDPDGRDSYLICIISDGLENASRRFDYSTIAETIQRLSATDRWTFTYLGSNQDLSLISQRMGIPAGYAADYASSPVGTREAWRRHGRSTRVRMDDVARGVPPSPFYKDEPEQPDVD